MILENLDQATQAFYNWVRKTVNVIFGEIAVNFLNQTVKIGLHTVLLISTRVQISYIIAIALINVVRVITLSYERPQLCYQRVIFLFFGS